jgi:hypothetical protein
MVQATSNASANTEDEFIELTAASGLSAFLKRVRISCNSPNSDVAITARVCILSAGGSGYTTGSAVKKRQNAPTAAVFTTIRVKNGTSAFSLGTVSSTLHQDNVNGRAIWEWIPRGNEEYVDSGVAGIIAIIIKVSSASIILNVNVEFEE